MELTEEILGMTMNLMRLKDILCHMLQKLLGWKEDALQLVVPLTMPLWVSVKESSHQAVP